MLLFMCIYQDQKRVTKRVSNPEAPAAICKHIRTYVHVKDIYLEDYLKTNVPLSDLRWGCDLRHGCAVVIEASPQNRLCSSK